MSTINTIVTQGIVLGTIASAGTYTSPLTITSSGGVETSTGNAIFGDASQAWTVMNQGTITAPGFGVELLDGGYVDNTGGRIEGSTGVYVEGTAGTVTNTGTIETATTSARGVYLTAGGSVYNNAGLIEGGTGVYIKGTAGTVTNSAMITSTATSGFGVGLDNGGSVGNMGLIQATAYLGRGVYIHGAAGTVTNSGTITAANGRAVLLQDGGTVTNTGTINATLNAGVYLLLGGYVGNSASGLIEGIIGVRIVGTAGTVVNSATIDGTATSIGAAVGLYKGGSVSNTGTGLIEGYSGVYIGGAAGTVTNSNTIIAAGIGGHGIGVSLGTGGSVGNTGSIAGYDGVAISGSAGTVTNSGTIGAATTSARGIYLGAGGSIYNNAGLIEGKLRGVYVYAGTATVTNASTITATGPSGAGVFLRKGGTVIDSGTITGHNAIEFGGAVGSNLLVLEHGYQLTGGISGAGTLELGGSAGGPLTANYNALSFGYFFLDVRFGAGGNDTLKVSNTSGTLPAATISGFTLSSDIVDLTGLAGGTIGGGTVNGSDQLVVSNSTQTVTLQLDASENYTGFIFATGTDGGSGTDVTPVPCFLRGTLILTERGEVPVEALAIGDRVITVSGEAKPITWIGRRSYLERFIAGNRAVLPIRIEAGALADGVPARDLFVSPEHALYINGALAPAGLLVDGATIRQVESIERLEYFHIELAAHDVILAEGAPAETYVECDNRGMFHNFAEFGALYPDAAPAPWQFCAPRLDADAPTLTAIRATLSERAEMLGYALDPDPDLHLIVDGEIVRPDTLGACVYRFIVPAGAGALAIVSRSAVPAEVDAASQDRRRLGVGVERIVLGGAGLRIEIGPDCPTLREGFHEDEGAHRWTDGMARLPEELLRPFDGAVTLEVQLITTELRYRLDPPAGAAGAKVDRRSTRPAPRSPGTRVAR